MAFTHRLRVRYAEVDQQGVVFNAHWLTYFDDAMTRYVESLGLPASAWGETLDVRLVRSELEWHGPAGFDDEVAIEVRPVRLGTSSFDLRFEATVGGRPAVTGVTTYVSTVPDEARSRPVPEPLRAALQRDLGDG